MQATPESPFRILLVEDNKGDVLLLRKCFERSRRAYEMRVVHDGSELFGAMFDSEANKAWPDIIMLDINLPRVTGLKALEALRQVPEMRPIPVLMLTSSFADDEIERAKILGAKGHVVKGSRFALEDIMSFANAAKNDKELWIYVGR